MKPTDSTSGTQPGTAGSPEIEVLLSTLLYLMSRYAQNPSEDLSACVADHLFRLGEHQVARQSNLSRTAFRLMRYWQGISNAKLSFPARAIH